MNKLLHRVTAPGQRQVAARDGLAKIFIRDMDLEALVGIYDHEKTTPQPLRINIELGVREGRASLTGDIDDTVDYEKIADGIRDIVDSGHVGLLETLAEKIADFCMTTQLVMTATVRLEKLKAVPGTAGVGIEITR